ncbi:hypothetical protein GFV12_06535 [Desulfurobacterium thermolithotrophum]|uniref:hypothetical protein n=1 Tax=Desulfurobacterium thermolithotrophum TaxID=64160 RepID=UPI0013D0F944|nr:hypothetical protein [Desulfurobacterium thermolithotrophum]
MKVSVYSKSITSFKRKKFFKRLKEQLSTKRLIFTVTTGRSGTAYLSKILSLIPNISAFHEPEPNFVDVMRLALEKPELAVKFWVLEKLPFIAKTPHNIYCETSHLFCKGSFIL